MKEIIEHLDASRILDSEVIKTLRRSIEEKYHRESKAYRADRLAKDIHKIIDSALHGCNQEEKVQLRLKLIETHLLKDNLPITKLNVFDQLIELDSQEDLLIERLKKWLLFEQSSKVELNNLRGYIKEHRVEAYQSLESLSEQTPIRTAETNDIAHPRGMENKRFKRPIGSRSRYMLLGFACIVILAAVLMTSNLPHKKSSFENPNLQVMSFHAHQLEILYCNQQSDDTGIPHYLKYTNISMNQLRAILELKNSKLVDEPYLSQLYLISSEHDLNPLLLLSIIGQEQGFVPRNHQSADQIINNPYNVYGSWVEYNTSFEDASSIAALTIINRLEARPNNVDPFKWMNLTYAEDDNWWLGTKTIFRTLHDELKY